MSYFKNDWAAVTLVNESDLSVLEISGKVTDVMLGNTDFLRVVTPKHGKYSATTVFYKMVWVYAIVLCSEAHAVSVAQKAEAVVMKTQ